MPAQCVRLVEAPVWSERKRNASNGYHKSSQQEADGRPNQASAWYQFEGFSRSSRAHSDSLLNGVGLFRRWIIVATVHARVG